MYSATDASIVGTYGLAYDKVPDMPGWGACLKLYYVYLDNYHPMLKWFIIACNHLRDDVGLLPANKQSSDKTHEFIVGIVDPESYLFESFNPKYPQPFNILPPLIVNYQRSKLTDANAVEITATLATAMVDGQQIPEEETRKHWITAIDTYNKWLNV